MRSSLPSLLLTSLLAAQGFAADALNVEITSIWARATPPVATMGAAYMDIKALKVADKLLGATTPVADHVEIHATTNNNGVMQMRPLQDVAITPGNAISLAPSGTHLMLVGLKAPLKEGDAFPLSLRFEQAGEITVMVGISRDAPKPGHMHH